MSSIPKVCVWDLIIYVTSTAAGFDQINIIQMHTWKGWNVNQTMLIFMIYFNAIFGIVCSPTLKITTEK